MYVWFQLISGPLVLCGGSLITYTPHLSSHYHLWKSEEFMAPIFAVQLIGRFAQWWRSSIFSHWLQAPGSSQGMKFEPRRAHNGNF